MNVIGPKSKDKPSEYLCPQDPVMRVDVTIARIVRRPSLVMKVDE